jgi:BirA family transcriptional regulator, biotin operon repressor / biotin---[acetyl-CoA-carboxylase] ligase
MEAAFRVLEVLETSDGPVSGEEISRTLSISRSAVWKHIKELKAIGYDISASQTDGYQLTKKSNRLLPYEVHKNLMTKTIGKKMRYFESTPSTISVAKDLAAGEDPSRLNGTVIIAEEQTGGVGRMGRVWVSPKGGIWFTIILKPQIPVDHVFMLTMAGAIAVARAIRKEFDLGALIKWPNDIYIGDKKVAGLLLELSAEADTIHYCLLGIGIDANLSPHQLETSVHGHVTSLSAELGHDIDRAALLARVLKEFENKYLILEGQEYDTLVREWKSLSCTLDQHVRISTLKSTFEGDAIDIDEYGALIIRKENGRIERVIAGDCVHT